MNENNMWVALFSLCALIILSLVLMTMEAIWPNSKVFTIVKPIILIASLYFLPFVLSPIIDLKGIFSVDWIAFIQDVIPENFGFPICRLPEFVA